MKNLNRRFLAITLGTVVLGAAIIFAIHHFQFNRQSEFFGGQAKSALLAEDYSAAIRLFQQALVMDPLDLNTLAGLAESYERVGNFNGCYNIAQRLARLSPADIDNQVRLARVGLQMQRFNDSISHITPLLAQPDTSLQPEPSSLAAQLPALPGQSKAELYGLLGDAKLGNRDVTGAVEAYRESVASGEAPMEIYVKLAGTLLDRADQSEQGRVVVDQMIERFPDRPEAYLARGRWFLSLHGNGFGHDSKEDARAEALENAVLDAKTAIKLADGLSPTETDGEASKRDAAEIHAAMIADSLEFAVEIAIADERLDDAIQLSEDGMERFPGRGAFYRHAHMALNSMREQSVDPDVQNSLVDRATDVLVKGVSRLPQDATLLWALASYHLEHGRMEAARNITNRLRSVSYARPLVNYLDARLLAASGDVSVAADRMEKVRSEVIDRPDLVRLVDLTLAELYEKKGDVDRQIAVMRRVVLNDPSWLPARERLALAYLRSGRIDEAVEEYRTVADRPGVPIRAPLNFARLLLMQNLGREPADRDWRRLESMIDTLSKQPSLATDMALLNAEILVAQEKPDLARLELANAPGEPRIWSARILLETTEQQYEAAAELIASAEAAIGDCPSLRYAQARAATDTNDSELDQKLSRWSMPPASWSAEQQLELAKSLVPLLISSQRYEDADRLARLSAELEPDNVAARLQLMQIAFQSEQPERLREQLSALEKVSGRDARWYYGSALAISLDKTSLQRSDDEMDEITPEANVRAQELLAEAAVLRPDWSLIPAFSANMHDRAGNIESAIMKYNQAVDLGWRSPASIRRLIQLLTERERFGEADLVIRRLRTGSQPFTSEMARIASEVSVEMADLQRAVRLAKQATKDSTEVEDFLWLGQLSEMNGDPAAAGQAYEQAIEIAPSAARPTLAWIGYLERNSRLGEARDALTRFEQSIDSSDPAKLLTLADGYQRIGSVDDAARVLHKVPAGNLTDLESYQRYLQIIVAANGESHGRKQLFQWLGISPEAPLASGADESSELASEPPEGAASDPDGDETEPETASPGRSLPTPVAHWARRQLALSLAATGVPSVYGQAKALIAANTSEINSAASTRTSRDQAFEDRRAAAIIDAIFLSASEPNVALEQFETMISEGWQPSTPDQFVVGQLSAATGDWTQGRRWMLPLLSSDELRKPIHIKTYIRLLLQNNDAAEAQLWLDRLQQSGIKDEEAAELTAIALLRRRNLDRLLELLTIQADDLVTADSEQQWFASTLSYSRRLDLLTMLTTQLMDDTAERLKGDNQSREATPSSAATMNPDVQRLQQAATEMKSHLEESGEFPGTFYAMQLLRRGECEAAVEAIGRIASTAPQEELVAFSDAVLVQPNCGDAYGKLAEVLRRVGGEKADNIVYAVLMARLREAQGDYDRAMETYEAILLRDPDHFAASNNLATLLSLRKQNPERALELIDRAIRLNGKTFVTLDTQGVCYLAAGQTEAAILSFLTASEIFPHPIILFHLAQASAKAGDMTAASEQFRRAVDSGLKRSELHPLEFAAYDSFKKTSESSN